eukprot:scaffold87655_cov35-Tisochrysis_lutea.AAC.1
MRSRLSSPCSSSTESVSGRRFGGRYSSAFRLKFTPRAGCISCWWREARESRSEVSSRLTPERHTATTAEAGSFEFMRVGWPMKCTRHTKITAPAASSRAERRPNMCGWAGPAGPSAGPALMSAARCYYYYLSMV